MIFKHIIFGGFLFAIACASTTPNIATLEVRPNFDQGLTLKDFRVIYPGVEKGSNVKIKIYKENDPDTFHTFDVPSQEVQTQKEYYFGLKDATTGSYMVQVCNGDSDCSGKTSSLGTIPKDKGMVTCSKGSGEGKEWQEVAGQKFETGITDLGDWLDENYINTIETVMNGGTFSQSTTYTEWRKNNVEKNPSYKDKVLYVGLKYNMLPYKPMFMTAEQAKKIPGAYHPDSYYVNEFCERKYLLSLHAHLVEKDSNEVKYRFKRTLYMSPAGKQYFILENTGTLRRDVHVELALKDTEIANGSYLVWVSLCTTEKDVNDSTMCSDPVVHDTPLTVSTSSSQ